MFLDDMAQEIYISTNWKLILTSHTLTCLKPNLNSYQLTYFCFSFLCYLIEWLSSIKLCKLYTQELWLTLPYHPSISNLMLNSVGFISWLCGICLFSVFTIINLIQVIVLFYLNYRNSSTWSVPSTMLSFKSVKFHDVEFSLELKTLKDLCLRIKTQLLTRLNVFLLPHLELQFPLYFTILLCSSQFGTSTLAL